MRQAVPDRPVILVTGTSSGIGAEAVRHLVKAGALVVATARDPAAIADLARDGPDGACTTMRLDVDDATQRAQAIAAIMERHGRIDAVVNNAGYGAMLAVEDTSPQALRAIFETNVVAAHDLARLALPHMRRQGHGRIVNVASIAGHIPVPLLGAYCASKFALRALTQAMDAEVRRFGVRACLIEPGVIRTNFGKRSLAEATRHNPAMDASAYAPLYRQWNLMRTTGRGAHPRVIARRIVHACLAASPRLHYLAPIDAKLGNVAKRVLPDSWLNAGFRWYFRGR